MIFREVDERFVVFSLFQPFFTCSYSFCDFFPPSVVINFFLQHRQYQYPQHEGYMSVLAATPLALTCKVQCIIHQTNKEYLIKILCSFIFFSILKISQEQFNQVFVQKLDSIVRLHDLNDILNPKSSPQ